MEKKILKDFNSKFWLSLAGVFLSLGWLLPNHYPPWTNFHSDFWVAIVLLVVSFFLFVEIKIQWEASAIFIAAICFIPIIQYFFDIIYDSGTAWINLIYLCGLFVSVILGFSWARRESNQCLDLIFLGLVIAGIFSVAIELHQWTMLDTLEFWVNRAAGRPSGNLSQPNQMATLLVLAVLGVGWHFQRKNVGFIFSMVAVLLMILGIALTQSRTGWVNLVIIFSAAIFWGWKYANTRLVCVSIGLFLYLLLCIFGLPYLHDALNLAIVYDLSGRGDVGIRPIIWNLLWHAALLKPWFGYGWSQTEHAHLALAADYEYLGATFSQAHNIFLDLLVWNGFAIGFVIIAAILWRMAKMAILARKGPDIVSLLSLCVLGLHAMLEYPLHYAYFLLPAGCIFGALSARLGFAPVFLHSPKVGIAMWMVAASMLAITLRDYSNVESSFSDLRFEKARIQMPEPGKPPDVWVLTQLRDAIILGRVEVTPNMSSEELEWMQKVTRSYPSAYNIRNLAFALALNNRGDEAQRWLKTMCKALPEQYCEGTRLNWQQRALHDPRIAAVPWPAAN